jgi:hypothetical protein
MGTPPTPPVPRTPRPSQPTRPPNPAARLARHQIQAGGGLPRPTPHPVSRPAAAVTRIRPEQDGPGAPHWDAVQDRATAYRPPWPGRPFAAARRWAIGTVRRSLRHIDSRRIRPSAMDPAHSGAPAGTKAAACHPPWARRALRRGTSMGPRHR